MAARIDQVWVGTLSAIEALVSSCKDQTYNCQHLKFRGKASETNLRRLTGSLAQQE